KPWTAETLKQVGGAEGVGVTFLEETFSARTAPPSYRIHQKAAQAVLRALLPETGSNIKGNMRSYDELLVVSSYGPRPNEFDELLRILNSELRLISPIEREGSESDGQTKSPVGEKFFLLTHDYLVPSIREWLTRKQKETRRGRAELRLAERSALWNAKPENRLLPSFWEWVTIGLLTRKKDWTDSQRRMMRRAGLVHGLWTLATVLVLAGLGISGLSINIKIGEANQETQAQGLVQRLLDADTEQVPEIVRSISAYRRWADPELKKTVKETADTSRKKLHASLALLPVDANQVDFLFSRLLAASPTELPVPVIRDALKPHQASLIPKLWSTLDSAKPGDVSLLRAASALADYDGTSPRWEADGGKVAEALVTVNPVFLGPWIDALLPVRMKLTTPLVTIFHDKKRPEIERTLATSILKGYASDDPDLLADLLLDSEEKPFAVLFDKLKARQERAVPVLEAELARKPAPDATADAQDQLAQRQARAAVALVRLGQGEKVWNLLRHSPDPSVRSYIVNWLKPLGAGPEALITKLEGIAHDPVSIPKDGKSRMDAILFHLETSERRALILALGRYNLDELSPDKREPLVEHLREMYRNDPDAGIHGAAEWTLRQWKQQKKLKELDAELMKFKDWGERRWYVNSQGQTYAVIEGPVEFRMGSPPTEPDRIAGNETPRRMVIPRRFAIADREVTVEQYQLFVKTNPHFGLDPSFLARYSPDRAGPMIAVNWYGAAAYCNWLSEQEGLPPDQWCYAANAEKEYDAGMTIPADVLKRTGYRLPTEAEWEFTCRAGAVTSRYYGHSIDLLDAYARYQANSKDHAWTCGNLLPNDLGLFDMLGNMYEWCQDSSNASQPRKEGIYNDIIKISESIVEKYPRLLRGGTFGDRPADVRSANRSWDAPSYRSTNFGFRPSRTYH
ncbi:MAG: formylglycine-generating enzyme family protein, partial [Isosphaeraceae bacterium]